MARPKVTSRKPFNAADHADAYSVGEFCARRRISQQLFYKLKPQGLMPVTFNVGTRVLICARPPMRGVARGKTSSRGHRNPETTTRRHHPKSNAAPEEFLSDQGAS